MRPNSALALAILVTLTPGAAKASAGHPALTHLARSAEWVSAGTVEQANGDGSFVVKLALPCKGAPPAAYTSPPIPERIDTWRPNVGASLLVYRLAGQIGFCECTSPESASEAVDILLRLDEAKNSAARTALLEKLVSAKTLEALLAARSYLRELRDDFRGTKLDEHIEYRRVRPTLLRFANESTAPMLPAAAVAILLDMYRVEDVESLLALARLHPVDATGSIPVEIMRTLSSLEPREETTAQGKGRVAVPSPPFGFRDWYGLKKRPQQFHKAIAAWQRWFDQNKARLVAHPALE